LTKVIMNLIVNASDAMAVEGNWLLQPRTSVLMQH